MHSGKQLCGRCILFDIIPPKEAGPGRIKQFCRGCAYLGGFAWTISTGAVGTESQLGEISEGGGFTTGTEDPSPPL